MSTALPKIGPPENDQRKMVANHVISLYVCSLESATTGGKTIRTHNLTPSDCGLCHSDTKLKSFKFGIGILVVLILHAKFSNIY